MTYNELPTAYELPPPPTTYIIQLIIYNLHLATSILYFFVQN